MFGKNKNAKNESVKAAARRPAAKKVVKKVARKKVGRRGPVRTKESKEVKRGSLRVGQKYFDNPEEISAYYKLEGERVKKAMRQFKIDQAEGYLGIAKNDLVKILSQKKRLGNIASDLQNHMDDLNGKLVDINSKKEEAESHKKNVELFVRKMKDLESQAKDILDTREDLIFKEAEIIAEMKKAAKLAQADVDLSDIATAKALARFEASKEAVLLRAKELIPEERHSLFADNSTLEKLDARAVKKIDVLNEELAKIQGAKKETLKKKHILEISEEETQDSLAKAEAKAKRLEDRYHKLLKKR